MCLHVFQSGSSGTLHIFSCAATSQCRRQRVDLFFPYASGHILFRTPSVKLKLMLIFGRHVLAGTGLGLLMFLAAAHGQAPPQAPAVFPAFDLDAMFTERPILAQFDASKNGRLENAERKVAREWLAKQPPTGLGAVIGRFAGPGGPGGLGAGAPPGLPPLGGRGLASGSPGQRLTPDAVRSTPTNRSTTRASCARCSCSLKTRTGRRSSRTSTTRTWTCRPRSPWTVVSFGTSACASEACPPLPLCPKAQNVR